MKILHICNDYSYSKVYKNLYFELDKLGITQIVYHPLRKKENIGKNFFDFEIPSSKIVYSGFFLKFYHRVFFNLKTRSLYKDMVRQIELKSVSLIYATTLFSDGSLAYKAYRAYGLPYIVAVRNTDVNLFLKYRPDLLQHGLDILYNAQKIIFISEGLKELFYSHEKIKLKKKFLLRKTLVIPNGIDNVWLDNIKIENNYCEKKMIFVGRFDKNKNCENVIKALTILRSKFPTLNLTLVGGGGNNNSKIQKLIKSRPWINYLGYISDKNTLRNIFREHNFFIMPSKYETFGLVYVEALSQGLALLYTKNQGIDGLFGPEIGVSTKTDLVSITKSLEILLQEEDYSMLNVNFDNFRWSNIAYRYSNIIKEIV